MPSSGLCCCKSIDTKKEGREALETTEMRMLRRFKGVTLRNRERSDDMVDIMRDLGVDNNMLKTRLVRLQLLWHYVEDE